MQWPGGGPLEFANPGPIPPVISTPVTGQWLDTNINSFLNPTPYYFPTDKQIKLAQSHAGLNGVINFDWIDVNGNGTWRIPPDPHSTDIWAFYTLLNPTNPPASTQEYFVRITDPDYYFEDVLLGALLVGDASVSKDVYTVVGGGKGSLLGSLSYNANTTITPALELHGYRELYIVDTIDSGINGAIGFYTSGFRQEVPAPLPLLGAGTALGFCRTLRRRLRAARLSPTN